MPVPIFGLAKKKKYAEYGCGHYGCVFPTRTKSIVFKVTSDVTEASFVTAAMQLRNLPDGIVRYHGVWHIEGESYRGRPVFILLREEASNVGNLSSQVPLENRVIKRLMMFKGYANVARESIQRSKSISILEEAERLEDWASSSVEYDKVTTISYPYTPHIPSWIKGAQRIAYAVQACKWIAQEMENEDVGYLVGGALSFFLDEGLLLADVHTGNIGQVEREDYTRPVWVITDPGHMVPLRERWLQIEVPALPV
jgi:hypothetical protein